MNARYALYYAPPAESAWMRFAERWFSDPRHAALTAAPRRYGFHATLKAPFRLARGSSVAALLEEVDRYCATRISFVAPMLRVERLRNFLALVPAERDPRLDALASDCVVRFERFRAPLTAAELARRSKAPLSAREATHLVCWGYPYVLDAFRFHFSLTGPLDGTAAPEVPEVPAEALHIDAVCVFEEPAPGAAFRLVHQARFGRRGRLVYVVGPSGSGKDALLTWVRRQNPPGVVFAQRTIDRPLAAHGEMHAPVTPSQFDRMQRSGAFALHWSANGQRYGIHNNTLALRDQGYTVVVNGSREHLPAVRKRFPDVEVIGLTAPRELILARLAARGREEPEQLASRMARHDALAHLPYAPLLEIHNDRPIEHAGALLLAHLQRTIQAC